MPETVGAGGAVGAGVGVGVGAGSVLQLLTVWLPNVANTPPSDDFTVPAV